MKFQFDEGYYYVISLKKIKKNAAMKFICRFHSLYIYRTKDSMVLSEYSKKNIIRYLDCFLLILPENYSAQADMWKDFYRCFGAYYDKLIDTENNIECIRTLLGVIDSQKKVTESDVILDFGCGNGLANKVKSKGKILGYEPVDEMGIQAKKRGMQLLTREEICALPESFFDAVFSSYVFHMSVREEEIALILGKMKRDALWVANFYKDTNIQYINNIFEKYGYVQRRIDMQEERFGTVYVYRK